MPPSLRVEYLHNLFGCLLRGRFVSSPPFTYLFNHLPISVWTYRYLFYTLVIIQYYFVYFVVQKFPALALASLSIDSCAPLT